MVSFTIARHVGPVRSIQFNGRAPVIIIRLDGRRSEFLARLSLAGNGEIRGDRKL